MQSLVVATLIGVVLLAWWIFAGLLVARAYFVLQERKSMQPGGPLR